MDTLQSVFPLVPLAALERVLDICDQNVEAASDWLLENDWQELIDEENEQGGGGEGDAGANGHAEQDEEDHGEVVDVTNDYAAPAHNGGGLPRLNGAIGGATSNVFARIQAARAAVASPASSNGEPRGLTMAVSTESAPPRATNGHAAGAVDGAGAHDQQHRTHHHHHRHHGRHRDDYDSAVDPDADSEDGDEEDEDEDDEDDEDDDEDDDGDANSYYDSSDESFFHNSLPPLTKRVKVTRDGKATNLETNEHFWAAFDGEVVPKTLIALLNTTLTKLAHNSVLLLKQSSKQIDEGEARQHLKSILVRAEERLASSNVSRESSSHIRPDSHLGRILNSSPPDSTPEVTSHAGQKRKRIDDSSSAAPFGFFAHFFSITDLDMVRRSILHAHVFNGRFGDLIEFHASPTGTFARRDFDELMHCHTHASSSRATAASASSLAGMKCCLLLPCEASEEEIFRVGKHVHTLLKLPGSLYYRTLDVANVEGNNRDNNPADLLNEDGKLTEDSFRRFARYRIRKEEVEADAKSEKDAGPDHFLAYQQQRKVDHCLQYLDEGSWALRMSG